MMTEDPVRLERLYGRLLELVGDLTVCLPPPRSGRLARDSSLLCTPPGMNTACLVKAFSIPSRRFAHLHVDLVGPVPASRDGFTHLFTIVERIARWPRKLYHCKNSKTVKTFIS